MNSDKMTSLQRVLTTLGHQEPDRVPLFLLLTMHGAKELGLSIKEYFHDAASVIEGQIRLREKFQNDCLYSFLYASVETEAFGGETIFIEDGPPNAADPIINHFDDISGLEIPDIQTSPGLMRVLEVQKGLKERIGDAVPIIGVVMSPFSLPVMQMGFERYLDLMFEAPQQFQRLMKINEEFCVAWANAQLTAGATAICYFDPISSSTIITPQQYRETGCEITRRTIARINGPTATHFASGRCLPILEDVMTTGTAMVGVSSIEDLKELKDVSRGKISLFGNLDGISMRRWTPEEAEENVKAVIREAAPGGGFVLSDNHGEIPYQVEDDVLFAISDAVRKWGTYPIVMED